MQYGQIPGLDKPVSRIVLGTMIVTTNDLERSFALLDAAYATGINAFDCAHIYGGGTTERAVGQWIRTRSLKDQVVVITKGCHHNADRKRVTPFDLAADLHDSLARLQMDSVDIYMLHRDDPAAPVGPIVEALNEHRRAGRLRAFGGSNWRHERIAEANAYAARQGLVPFTVSSPNYGLAEQVQDPWGPGCVGLGGPANAAARAWYEQTGLAVFAYSSLGRGLFSGRITRDNYAQAADGACRTAYCHEVNFRRLDRVQELARKKGVSVPQLALAYALTAPMNVFALVGAASREECQANVAALDIPLTPAERAWLDLQTERLPGG